MGTRMNRTLVVVGLVTAVLVAFAGQVEAADRAAPKQWKQFRTPSRNIVCLATYAAKPESFRGYKFRGFVLVCTVYSEKTDYFLPARGHPRSAGPNCDPGAGPSGPILQYGQTWRRGPFRCNSQFVGLTCSSILSGKGFFLSRDDQHFLSSAAGSCPG